jgi:REase_AHJR-like
MTPETTEAEILRGVVAELGSQGYEVFVQPRPPLAPSFLGNVRPDAIAIRGDKKILIEITRKSGDAEKKTEQLRNLLKDQPDWELRVIWISPASANESLQVQSSAAIRKNIDEIKMLVSGGYFGAALLLGWASFEAASRALITDQFKKPQSPARLVEVLAAAGYITPSEADRLRGLAKKRTYFIHGQLQIEIASQDVQEMIAILNTMLEMIEKGPANI